MTIAEPTHRRGQVVDDAILAAVITEIEADRTLKIRVDSVAERAGVNKTTIYRRYRDRDALVLAAVLANADTLIPIPDTGTLRRDLTELAEMVRATVTSPLGQALLSASADTTEFVELRSEYWRVRFDAAASILRAAAKRGECNSDVDAQLLIEVMVAPIHFRASQTSGTLTDEFLRIQVERLLEAVSI